MDGKQAEKLFQDHLLKTRGKNYFLHRFTDASDIKGRTGRVGVQGRQPSDFITVIDGVMAFSEVKTTQGTTSFGFGLLSDFQHRCAERVLLAGGEYVVFVWAAAVKNWFRIPYRTILETRDRQSLRWSELQPWT